MEKYGFVYIWYDRKRKMYYIGSHWGHVDDGYICSSNRMRDAYRRRPNDFKRRILIRIDDRNQLLDEEQKWFDKVKRKEKYYNISFTTKDPWWHNEPKNKSTRQKLKDNHWSKNVNIADDIKKKLSEKGIGRTPPNKGVPWSDELRKIYKDCGKGIKQPEKVEEHRRKLSENSKRLQFEKKIGMHGKVHSDDTLKKMSEKQSGKNNPMYGKSHTEEARKKIQTASIGRKHTEEAKDKIRNSKKGKPFTGHGGNSPEVIKKRALTNTGKKRTPEQKERMRQARLSFLNKKNLKNI